MTDLPDQEIRVSAADTRLITRRIVKGVQTCWRRATGTHEEQGVVVINRTYYIVRRPVGSTGPWSTL